MSEHVQRQFQTPEPITLEVEVGAGSVTITATDTTQTTVDVTGRHAQDVTVGQSDGRVSVLAPRRRASVLGGNHELDVRVSLPTGSIPVTQLGSADLDASGRLGGCRLRSGSGDIRLDDVDGQAAISVGSGDVTIGRTGELQVKSGSGDIDVEAVTGTTTIASGSGDVNLGQAGDGATVKTGSGDVSLAAVHGDVALTTASGDLQIGIIPHGEVRVKSASGDVRVGIPDGTPVWTDISAISGTARADITSTGPPAEGQDHVRVRVSTVSGNVLLHQA